MMQPMYSRSMIDQNKLQQQQLQQHQQQQLQLQQQQQHRIPYPESVCLLYTYKTNKLHSQLDAAINDATKLWWC